MSYSIKQIRVWVNDTLEHFQDHFEHYENCYKYLETFIE